MAIDNRLIALTSLNEYFVDKNTGEALSNGTLKFFKDSNHSTPKSVYALSGVAPNYTYVDLGSVITLNAAGTAQDAGGNNVILYAFPYEGNQTGDSTTLELYHIKCFDSGAGAQWTRDAIPGLTAASDPIPGGESILVENQLSNPQFSKTFLNDGANTINFSSAISKEVLIAPDWALVVTGSGDVTVTREAIKGNETVPTLPAFNIKIQVGAGITNCRLRQRLYNNSGLWGNAGTDTNTGWLNSYFVAKSDVPRALSFYYQDNTITEVLLQTVTTTTAFAVYRDSAQCPAGALSPTSSTTGFIDLYFVIENGSVTYITSVQVVPTPYSDVASDIHYDQRSSNRELALMGDYYIPALEKKLNKSHLMAWDFSKNPAQFLKSGSISRDSSTSKGDYIWDHTIAGKTGTAPNFTRNATTKGLQITTTAPTTMVSLMQYIDTDTVQQLFGGELSVHVRAHITGVGTCTGRIYLTCAPSGGTFPDMALVPVYPAAAAPTYDVIGSTSASGEFTPGGLWKLVNRDGKPAPKFTVNNATTLDTFNSVDIDHGFNGWKFDDALVITPDKMAIVVSFVMPTSATVLTVDSISLQKGSIPTLPAPQSKAEVLLDCQRYYEKSYNNDVMPATVTTIGAESHAMQIRIGNVGANTSYSGGRQSFNLQYKANKRAIPKLSFYALSTGTVDRFEIYKTALTVPSLVATDTVSLFTGATPTGWLARGASERSVMYMPIKALSFDSSTSTSGGGSIASQDFNSWSLQFQYTADSRLGVVT